MDVCIYVCRRYVCTYYMFTYISYTYRNDSPSWYSPVNPIFFHHFTPTMVTSYRNWDLKNLRPIDVKPPKSGWRILHKARSLMTSPQWWEANIWKAEVIWGNPPVGWKRLWKPGILGFIRQSSPVLVWIRVVSRKDIERPKEHMFSIWFPCGKLSCMQICTLDTIT